MLRAGMHLHVVGAAQCCFGVLHFLVRVPEGCWDPPPSKRGLAQSPSGTANSVNIPINALLGSIQCSSKGEAPTAELILKGWFDLASGCPLKLAWGELPSPGYLKGARGCGNSPVELGPLLSPPSTANSVSCS